MAKSSLFRLQCGVNSYDWGKIGSSSAAAKYAAATSQAGFEIEDGKPYSELWMGTHPSNPSKDIATRSTLLNLIQDNPSLLSKEVAGKYDNKLPFLFKILSIEKALSIQAHPNKDEAVKLHAKDPKNYPDDNHKPEMAIALTPFTGLCGFRPLEEIARLLQNVPSLRELVGETQVSSFVNGMNENGKKVLKATFSKLMQSTKDEIVKSTASLLHDVKENGTGFAKGTVEGQELSQIIPGLNKQFPDDIGLFVLFFLNYIKLNPGEATFLKADDIHAYISGDIIECMASSDNVIRAGFTPKFKDIDTLVSVLTYDYAPIEDQKLEPTAYINSTMNAKAYSSNSRCELYDPPTPEFSVLRTDIGKAEGQITHGPIDGPSIIICTNGEGTINEEEINTGYVYFVGAGVTVKLVGKSDGDFVTFRAFCE